ncbi:hypothetical protein [Pleurocapsa sp. FMAR1]|uniref:hypothetical protein n=1 Tax=Pleurocapsa sp. FMAR1 TaxID=3040204 RepID=UPI0029C73567|nr:hypothetical protein [Pleurocapsa sp. FMAR1]
MATRNDHSIGVYIGGSVKILIEKKANVDNLSLNQYIAGLIYQDSNLPSDGREANQTAELILRVE